MMLVEYIFYYLINKPMKYITIFVWKPALLVLLVVGRSQRKCRRTCDRKWCIFL